MARPIWTGSISFGLLNIPIQLMSGERRTDIHFRMLDARDNSPIRYERVNAETGEEVPWKEIVKAYEFSKDNYVVLQPEDIERAATENHETIAIEAFVDRPKVRPFHLMVLALLDHGSPMTLGEIVFRLYEAGADEAGRPRMRCKRPGMDSSRSTRGGCVP